MGNTGKISYYIGEDGKVHEDRFDGGKGITTVAPSLVGSFQDWLFKTYGKTYNPQKGLETTRNQAVDQTIANRFSEYFKGQEGGTGTTSALPQGSQEVQEILPTTTDGNALKEAFAAAGQKGSVSDVGMGFGEYIKSYGVDTDKAYSQAVRGATNDFYRSLMTYGQRAEGLAGAGLTSSGVSDYGNAAAYAARQGAVATAGAAKLETDAKQAASFAEYIKGVKETALAKEKQQAQERVNLLTALLSSGYDPETAGAVMDSSGLVDDEQKAAFMAAIEKNAMLLDNKEREANVANVENAMLNLIGQGYTEENAANYLKGLGYDATIVDERMLAHKKVQADQVITNIEATLNDPNYNAVTGIGKKDLDTLVAQKVLDKDSEEYNEILADIRYKNAKSLMELRNMATIVGDKGKDLETVYNQLGGQETFGTPYADNEDIQNGIAAKAIQLMREKAEEMYNTKSISEEDYIKYLDKDFTYELNSSLEKETGARGDAVASTLSKLYDYADEGMWEQCLDKIFDEHKITFEHRIENGNIYHSTYYPSATYIHLKIDDKIVCSFDVGVINDQQLYPDEKINIGDTNYSIRCHDEPDGNKQIQIAFNDVVRDWSYRNFKETDNKDKTNAIARIVEYYIKTQNNK